MSDEVKDWFRNYSPLFKAVALIGCVVLCAIFLTDWSGKTGWFLFVLLGMAGSLIYLGFKIWEVCANLYVERNYTSAGREKKKLSYKQELRLLRRQRRKAVKGIYENRGHSSLRVEWERYLENIEKKILEHTGMNDK